jgi:chromate reductase, NAD(P)H dehydrogenase (quinone)
MLTPNITSIRNEINFINIDIMNITKIAAISGSIKQNSANSHILRFIQKEFSGYNVELVDLIDQLPFFNPDIDNENPPASVKRFREVIRLSDGVIICTPEYAFNIPGVLKNALDWMVSSGEFNQKPVITITASPLPSGGDKAQISLRNTLTALGCEIYEDGKLLIGGLRTKMTAAGEITDLKLREDIQLLLEGLASRIKK